VTMGVKYRMTSSFLDGFQVSFSRKESILAGQNYPLGYFSAEYLELDTMLLRELERLSGQPRPQTPQTGVLGLSGAGIPLCPEKPHTGLHMGNGGVTALWGGRCLFIHTFPLSLRELPLTAVQQVVAIAGLAMIAVLQHLHVAFDIDEAFVPQFVKRSPCRRF